MQNLRLIPQPRTVTFKGSGFSLQSAIDLSVQPWELAESIRTKPESLGLEINTAELEQWEKEHGSLPESFDREQGYALEIASGGITIAADTATGRFYAFQTLAQIVSQAKDGSVPALTIVDWPVMQVRGIHACYHLATEWMPESVPNFESLIEMIKTISHYKSNALLFEVEAMFPHKKHPAVSCKIAFTPEQIEEIRDTCRERGVEMIPLLQCLGHAYHVLRNPEYAHLRETPNTNQQYCPQNPEARKLYLELVEEIREAFPEIKRFHLGGDESRRLGVCPKCADKVERDGVGALYGEHVGAVAESVLDMGLVPMVWTDIMEKYPDALNHLPGRTEFVYWNYTVPEKESNLSMFAKDDRAWAASGIRFGGCNSTMYLFGKAMTGIRSLAEDARRLGVSKFIATDWMKAIPHELSNIGRAYACEESWNGGNTFEEFVSSYSLLNHACEDTRLSEAYQLLAEPIIPYCEDAQFHQYDGLDRYDLSGYTMRERIAVHTQLRNRDNAVDRFKTGLANAEKALQIVTEIKTASDRGKRELDILELGARTNILKARMGLAIDDSVQLIKHPVPGDDAKKPTLAAVFDELIREHNTLKEETRRLLASTMFKENLAVGLEAKFEPAAVKWMEYFRDILLKGETVRYLLGPDGGPGE